MMRFRFRRFATAALLAQAAVLAPKGAHATVPQGLTDQGRLFDSLGNPLIAVVSLTVSIYPVAAGGTAVWTETQPAVTLDNGYFSVELGSVTPIPEALWTGSALYVGIAVDSDPEMTPRQPTYSVPYALVSDDAVGAIHPTTVSVNGQLVIDANGDWVGPSSGLVGATGPAGATGAAGTTGLAGATGAAGPAGSAGPQGPQGPIGATGAQGPAGADGATGAVGAAGADGATGATGAAGPMGAQGSQGPQGPMGAAGANGAQGAVGGQGPAGAQGATGAAGATGAQGGAGANGSNGAQGATGTAGSNGAQGAIGTAGSNGAQGAIGMAGSNGAQGATGTAGSNGAQGATGGTGPQGAAGSNGAQGATGTQGTAGANGTQGATGAQGAAGANGANGAPGTAGANGAQGTTGSTGAQGANGAQGTTGTTGATGSTGATGAQGATGATGTAGATGAQGGTGAQGATGATGTTGSTGATGATGATGSQGATGTGGTAGAQGAGGPTGPQGANGAQGAIGAQGAGGLGGSGTTNFVPVFLSTGMTLGNSVIQQAQPGGWSNTAVGFNGTPGSGATTSPVGVDIQGTVTEGTPNGYSATQLVVEGSVSSSFYAQAYLRGLIVSPTFNFSAGYGNFAEGAYIGAPSITAGYANVVASLELGQPAAGGSGTSCSAALDIDLPNQNGNCPVGQNRVWSIYNGSTNNSYFAGNVGFGQPLPAYPIQTGGGAYVTTGGVWTNASSRALKKDILPLPAGDAMATLAGLDPVTFKYIAGDEAHVGFIAEDVPDLVAAKDRKGLSAMDIVAVLTKVVQEQQKELTDQREELDALKAQLAK